ncbi:MAG: hypothetical protein HYS21_10260 [Deltaproteobacteria bacterium]|nr:hypothetical protein [Deltaproteobacteria bacterium]
MEDLEAFLKKFLNDLAALPEVKMRLTLLAKRLIELGPERAARFIDLLYQPHYDKTAVKARAILINSDNLKESLGADNYRQIYLASIRLELTKVSRFFTDLPPVKEGPFGYDKEEEIKMEYLSLGQRRALSKKPIKTTIDRLLSDPDPMVISNLLNNPRTTEKEVLKIASKRPNSAAILKLIASHKVWSKRYEVIKAIALNPYSPPRTAIALLEFLMVQDLKQVMEDKSLHPQVKSNAGDLLKSK